VNKKRIAIVVGSFALAGGALLIAAYLAGTLYFLLNKQSPQGVRIDTWWLYWQTYSNLPAQRKFLQLSAGLAGFVFFVLPFLIWSSMVSNRRSLHGDARFATMGEVRRAGLFSDKGIIVGKLNGRFLMYEGQQFVLLAAPTRSGKGVGVVIPNLLNHAGSVVVLDVKMENFKLTSGYRAKHGQKVFLFSPFAKDYKTHRWNVLDGVNRHRNARVGDVQAIAQVLYPGDPTGKDPFWADQARNLFLGIALYLLDTPELPCTLGEMLRQSSGKGQPLKTYLQDLIEARGEADRPLCEECVDALSRFCATSDNTLASILATFNAPLTIFANPVVDAATSASDFDITMVRRRPMSIYIGVEPNRFADASLLINLFFSQLINLNTATLPEADPSLKHQCLVLLDEFTALGRIGIIAKAVAFIAAYNMRLVTVIQSIAQLEAVYGEKDTRTFVTNHALQILYPPREQKDANEYSEMLGYMTQKALSEGISRPRAWGSGNNQGSTSENMSDHRRALMLPQELREMGQDSQIVIAENIKPILASKVRYYSDHAFIDRLKVISKELRALGRSLPQRKDLDDAALCGALAAPVPVLDIDLHKARVEHRVRPLGPDEPIDLAKLAGTPLVLPVLTNQEEPIREELDAVVDALWAHVEWVDPLNEPLTTPATTASGPAPGNGNEQELQNCIEDASSPILASPPRRPRAAVRTVPIDLSLLDQ